MTPTELYREWQYHYHERLGMDCEDRQPTQIDELRAQVHANDQIKRIEMAGRMTTTCYDCGYEIDSTTYVGAEAHEPSHGDLSVCLNCGALCVFEGRPVTELRPISSTERATVMKDAETYLTIVRAQAYIRQRGPIPNANKPTSNA